MKGSPPILVSGTFRNEAWMLEQGLASRRVPLHGRMVQTCMPVVISCIDGCEGRVVQQDPENLGVTVLGCQMQRCAAMQRAPVCIVKTRSIEQLLACFDATSKCRMMEGSPHVQIPCRGKLCTAFLEQNPPHFHQSWQRRCPVKCCAAFLVLSMKLLCCGASQERQGPRRILIENGRKQRIVVQPCDVQLSSQVVGLLARVLAGPL